MTPKSLRTTALDQIQQTTATLNSKYEFLTPRNYYFVRGPKNTLLYIQHGPLQNNYLHSTQLPTKIVPNNPITQSYPKIPNYPQITNITHEYYSF